jgi:hypothetical protein
MNTKRQPLASIGSSELASVWGGGWLDKLQGARMIMNAGKATGVGPPSTWLEMADKPQKALDGVSNFLGIPGSGQPGDTYKPASIGSDGSFTSGSFESPQGDVSAPISQ